jgi:hypothetical protein
MERCSELVMQLNGAEATDGMFDLVFGRNQGKHILYPHSTLAPSSLRWKGSVLQGTGSTYSRNFLARSPN